MAFGHFKGLYFKENSDGYVTVYPWLLLGKKNVIFKAPATSFEQMFKQPERIVSQIRGGKFDSNYIISENKKPMLLRRDVKRTVDGEKIRVIDLSEQERQEYEAKIEELRKKIGEFAKALEDMRKKEIEYETELAEKEVAANAAIKERDVWAAKFAVLAQKQEGTAKQLASAVTAVQDLAMHKTLTERQNWALLDAIREKDRLLSEHMPKEVRELEREKLKEDLNYQVELIKSLPRIQEIKKVKKTAVKKPKRGEEVAESES